MPETGNLFGIKQKSVTQKTEGPIEIIKCFISQYKSFL